MTDAMIAAGPIRLDPAERRLFIGGKSTRLGGKGFDMLATLMRNAGRLVTKQELIDAVWAGRAVSETVLTTAAKEIRQALGDDARQPRFIEMVPAMATGFSCRSRRRPQRRPTRRRRLPRRRRAQRAFL